MPVLDDLTQLFVMLFEQIQYAQGFMVTGVPRGRCELGRGEFMLLTCRKMIV